MTTQADQIEALSLALRLVALAANRSTCGDAPTETYLEHAFLKLIRIARAHPAIREAIVILDTEAGHPEFAEEFDSADMVMVNALYGSTRKRIDQLCAKMYDERSLNSGKVE